MGSPVIDLYVFTAGRREYLERTLASAAEHLQGSIDRHVIVDDSGNVGFGDWLRDRYADFEIVSHGSNWGYTETMAATWAEIAEGFGSPYIFHLEEDFTFDQDVPLARMAALLEEAEPPLAQVVLLRGAFYPKELDAGGIIQEHPESYRQREAAGVPYLEHTRFFSSNPCLYKAKLTEVGWPQGRYSEAVIGPLLVKQGYRFAFLGQGEPWITHIGLERAGVGGY